MNFLDNLQAASVAFDLMLEKAGYLAPLVSTILIYLESLFAFLPLCVFITINVVTLGPILGVVISWIFTTLGGITVCWLFRIGLAKFFNKNLRRKKKVREFMKMIERLSYKNMVLICSIPFMPSFFINLCIGLSKVELKKYFYVLCLSKLCIVIFWAYIGNNIIECLINPIKFIEVIILLAVTYIIAKIVSKKLNIE